MRAAADYCSECRGRKTLQSRRAWFPYAPRPAPIPSFARAIRSGPAEGADASFSPHRASVHPPPTWPAPFHSPGHRPLFLEKALPNPVVAAGAIALNIAGTFSPGTLPPEPPREHVHAHRAWQKIPSMKQVRPHLQRHDGVLHRPVASQINEGPTWSGSAYIGSLGQFANGAISSRLSSLARPARSVRPATIMKAGCRCGPASTVLAARR
jgi:hypothetical protein